MYSTRKVFRNVPSRFTSMPMRIAFTGRGDSRKVLMTRAFCAVASAGMLARLRELERGALARGQRGLGAAARAAGEGEQAGQGPVGRAQGQHRRVAEAVGRGDPVPGLPELQPRQ